MVDEKDEKPCPNCGHCPTCGRNSAHYIHHFDWTYRPQPYYPWHHYLPTFTLGGTSTTNIPFPNVS